MLHLVSFRSRNCFYCQEHPIHLPIEDYQNLHFPLLDLPKEHYHTISEVYGKPLDDKDQPSKVASPSEDQKKIDRERNFILTSAKVMCMWGM